MTPFQRAGAVALDATGAGSVTIAVPWGERWDVTRLAVSTDGTGDPMPTCHVYRGTVAAVNLLDATYTGGLDVSDLPAPLGLAPGESITFVWAGGTAGEEATAVVHGTVAGAGYSS